MRFEGHHLLEWRERLETLPWPVHNKKGWGITPSGSFSLGYCVCELTVSIEGIEGLVACCASIGFAVEDSELEFLPRGLRISCANWAFNHLDPNFNTS